MKELCGIARRSTDTYEGGGKKGDPCRRPAGWGTDHRGVGPCRIHLGSSPAHRVHGARVLADIQLRKELKAFAVPLEGPLDPQQTLLAMVREAAGNVAYLGARVRELSEKDDHAREDTLIAEDLESDDAHVSGRGTKWSRLTGYTRGAGLFGPDIVVDKEGDEHVVGEKERGMVKLYGEWVDRLAKFSKMALDAGIAKAQVELAKTQGQTIVVVVNRVLGQMGLDEAKLLMARELLQQEFRQLGAGDTSGDPRSEVPSQAR